MSVKNNLLLSIENEIRKGIKEKQFEVFYQPQIDLESGEVSGIEALPRWNQPTQGLLSPSHFLSVAEESGLICELGGLRSGRNSGRNAGLAKRRPQSC